MEKKVEEEKHQLQNVEVANQQQAKQIVLVNQELKYLHLTLKGCSFVDVRPEDFKPVLCKIEEEFGKNVIDLYIYFDEMQGLYEKFIKHSKTIEDHHHLMRVAFSALEQVRGWKKDIKERPNGLGILDKLELKKTEVCIDTWEAMCVSFEAVVNARQKVCKNRWSTSNNFLTYLSLPVLEPLSEAVCPKVHLEEVEK